MRMRYLSDAGWSIGYYGNGDRVESYPEDRGYFSILLPNGRVIEAAYAYPACIHFTRQKSNTVMCYRTPEWSLLVELDGPKPWADLRGDETIFERDLTIMRLTS